MLETKHLAVWGRSFLSLLADLITVYPPASALGASLLSSVLTSMPEVPLVLRVGLFAAVFILAFFGIKYLIGKKQSSTESETDERQKPQPSERPRRGIVMEGGDFRGRRIKISNQDTAIDSRGTDWDVEDVEIR